MALAHGSVYVPVDPTVVWTVVVATPAALEEHAPAVPAQVAALAEPML